jgi:hypothetical protein
MEAFVSAHRYTDFSETWSISALRVELEADVVLLLAGEEAFGEIVGLRHERTSGSS